MESIRFHVQDCLYALLVTYLKTGSRDIRNYNLSWRKADRVVTLDSIPFYITNQVLGQAHEIPGVNLMMLNELSTGGRTNRPIFTRLATIDLYILASDNLQADNRTIMKLQRLIDEALYGGGMGLMDLSAVPPVEIPRASVSWSNLLQTENWLELTDLASGRYLHRSRNLQLIYAEADLA